MIFRMILNRNCSAIIIFNANFHELNINFNHEINVNYKFDPF